MKMLLSESRMSNEKQMGEWDTIIMENQKKYLKD